MNDAAPCNIMRCDSLARKYLPGIRAEMVNRLVNDRGISQSDAARKLGITRAAISQYLSGKRGSKVTDLSDEMSALIDRWALAVCGEEIQINICDVCRCAWKRYGLPEAD